MTARSDAPDGTELEAARILLARMGITPEQLLAAATPFPQIKPVPTFADYIDRVSDAVTAGTRRVYDTYWRCRLPRAWDHLERLSAMSMGPPGCQ